jgi:hypothetical protein
MIVLWLVGLVAVAYSVLYLRWLRARGEGGPWRSSTLGWRILAVLIAFVVMRIVVAALSVSSTVQQPVYGAFM